MWNDRRLCAWLMVMLKISLQNPFSSSALSLYVPALAYANNNNIIHSMVFRSFFSIIITIISSFFFWFDQFKIKCWIKKKQHAVHPISDLDIRLCDYNIVGYSFHQMADSTLISLFEDIIIILFSFFLFG